jgi:hypothetical protein
MHSNNNLFSEVILRHLYFYLGARDNQILSILSELQPFENLIGGQCKY